MAAGAGVVGFGGGTGGAARLVPAIRPCEPLLAAALDEGDRCDPAGLGGMKALATIEARMGSTRLPAKTLMDVAGQPLLQRGVDRIALARSVDGIVVATSTSAVDDAIARYCDDHAIACFRGSEDDVLDR